MTVEQALRAINSYPVPHDVILDACESADIDAQDAASWEMRQTVAFRAAKAKIYRFLSIAPKISQGGVSYSLSEESKAQMRAAAERLESGKEEISEGALYGYKGARL